MAPEAEVLAVAGGVLGDQVELQDAGLLELAGLRDQALDAAAAEAAAPDRDGAEGARVVAAFGDLEVGVAAGGEQAGRGVVEDQVGGRRQRRPAAQLHPAADLPPLVQPAEPRRLRDL